MVIQFTFFIQIARDYLRLVRFFFEPFPNIDSLPTIFPLSYRYLVKRLITSFPESGIVQVISKLFLVQGLWHDRVTNEKFRFTGHMQNLRRINLNIGIKITNRKGEHTEANSQEIHRWFIPGHCYQPKRSPVGGPWRTTPSGTSSKN